MYLAFHTLHGEAGLYALAVQSFKKEKLEQELAEVRAEREFMEQKVTMMRAASLDPDLLDEEARKMLGYAASDEWIILTQ